MFLIDTNIWLEQLLEQRRSGETKRLLQAIPSRFLFITSFSVYSIGIALTAQKKFQLYDEFLTDLFEKSKVNITVATTDHLKQINQLCSNSSLDFDDAFQKVISDFLSLKIVSFDQDFKKAGFKVLNPEEAIKFYIQSQS